MRGFRSSVLWEGGSACSGTRAPGPSLILRLGFASNLRKESNVWVSLSVRFESRRPGQARGLYKCDLQAWDLKILGMGVC